jgi:hypothetical protein
LASTPPSSSPNLRPAPQRRRRIGRGRSGVVYAETAPDGAPLACKVFRPDRASTLVMWLLTGAGNPYGWSAAAAEAANLRRRILTPLLQYWFGDRLRLPRTHGVRWNEDERAYELVAERVAGRHALLQHDLAGDQPQEARELVHAILRPLQSHLADAGFDGLLWQAGLGNPVAASNFMRETRIPGATRWVWIDLESGVPALFPLNPWRLVRNFLPLSIKHGRWLFDDVDVDRLRHYLAAHEATLRRRLPSGGWARLQSHVTDLEDRQRRWKSLRRHQRSISSRLARGRIDPGTARAYWQRPGAWLGRVSRDRARSALRRLAGAPAWLARRLAPRVLLAGTARTLRFFFSQRVRARWARAWMRRRLLSWRARGFLDRAQAARARASLEHSGAAEYVADFGVHLAIKPFLKVLQWGLVPLLYVSGTITSGWLAAALVLGGGALGRTLYTLGRSVQAALRGRSPPWVALLAGAVPVFGNAAFPLQLLSDTARKDGDGARFLTRDIVTGIGRRLPVWGGPDTLTEHAFNRIAGVLVRG